METVARYLQKGDELYLSVTDLLLALYKSGKEKNEWLITSLEEEQEKFLADK